MANAEGLMRAHRMLLGWIPGVSRKEARQFVSDLVDKHCDSPTQTSYYLLPFEGGIAYEIHEGGPRRAFLPRILKHFAAARSEGKPASEVERLVLHTETRAVQVELGAAGFISLQMPESASVPATDWLEAGPGMQAVAPARWGVLIVGAVVFATGIAASVASMATRYQPYEQPPAVSVKYLRDQLPTSQLRRLSAVPESMYVDKLEYRDGKWALSQASADSAEGKGSRSGEPEPAEPVAAPEADPAAPVGAPVESPGATPSASERPAARPPKAKRPADKQEEASQP